MEETGQTAEKPTSTPGTSAWKSEVWGPLVLLTMHGLFAFFFNPIPDGGPSNEELGGLLIGVLLSQPMMCAWWAAWATAPLVWRAPTGIAASVFLLLMASLRKWDAMLAILCAVLGVVFWALFALLRQRTGWRLAATTSTSLDPSATLATQFGLRFLIGWTTVVAALCALAKAVTISFSGMNENVQETVMVAVVFTLLVLPAPAVVQLTLAGSLHKRQVIIFALVVVACVMGAAILATSTGNVPDLREVVTMFSCFSVGAITGGAASAAALRWSGYRMVRMPPSLENIDGR